MAALFSRCIEGNSFAEAIKHELKTWAQHKEVDMGDFLKGKSAVVTGAGRGIGRAIALAMAREGAGVVVNDIGLATIEGGEQSRVPADEVVAEIKGAGGNAIASYDDVGNFAAAGRIVRSCVDSFGSVDILVNNAVIFRHRSIFDMTEEDWDVVIATDLKGAFNLCRHAIPLMKGRGYGRVINVTSRKWMGDVGMVNYLAAKGGMVSLTYGLAFELGEYGITCNAIAPVGRTRASQSMLPDAKRQNRPGPEFVPPLVVYLASEHGAPVNGKVFYSGGGRIAIFSVPEEIRRIYKDVNKGPWTVEELIKLAPETLMAE